MRSNGRYNPDIPKIQYEHWATKMKKKLGIAWVKDGMRSAYIAGWEAGFDHLYKRSMPVVKNLPIHRTEAGYPRCSTCDGGGCPDCTDPA